MWRRETKGWTAKLAAMLFVFQTLLLGFSAGASAASIPRDQFGNVLCIGGTSGHGGGERDGHHSSMPGCCTFGCNGFTGSLPPPAADALPPHPRADLRRLAGVSDDRIRIVPALSAHRPRGPPPTLST